MLLPPVDGCPLVAVYRAAAANDGARTSHRPLNANRHMFVFLENMHCYNVN